MKPDIMNKFDDLFKDLDHLSIENLEAIVHESLKFFEQLKDKLNSPNEEERAAALAIAQELQKKLEEQAEKALKATGMDKSQLETFLHSATNFSPEEWKVLERTQHELTDYQKELYKGLPPESPKPGPRKTRPSKITRLQA